MQLLLLMVVVPRLSASEALSAGLVSRVWWQQSSCCQKHSRSATSWPGEVGMHSCQHFACVGLMPSEHMAGAEAWGTRLVLLHAVCLLAQLPRCCRQHRQLRRCRWMQGWNWRGACVRSVLVEAQGM